MDEEEVRNLTSEQEGIVTMYAQWKLKPKYKTTYDLNGGTLEGKRGRIIVESYDGDVITVKEAPAREGYTFEYWKGSKYFPGDQYTVKEDHVLTAVWKKKTDPDPTPDDNNGARTGDESHLLFWFTLMTLSLIGLIAAALTLRRRQN